MTAFPVGANCITEAFGRELANGLRQEDAQLLAGGARLHHRALGDRFVVKIPGKSSPRYSDSAPGGVLERVHIAD